MNTLPPSDAESHAKPLLLVFGEVLWDMLPAGANPGGAPANVAVLAHAIGANCSFVSAVGDDALGREMLARLNERTFPTTHVQRLSDVPTGVVDVSISGAGIPDYNIRENVAWDRIELTAAIQEAASKASALYFGSLAQRAKTSRETVRALLKLIPANCLRFFDVNLRKPFPEVSVIRESLEQTDILKLNHEELPLLAKWLGLSASENDFVASLFGRFPVRVVLLTKGPAGADVFENGREPLHVPASPVKKIADTVGAGDAFSAGFIDGCLRELSCHEAAQRGSEFAARVCEVSGAWIRKHRGK